MIVLLSDTGMEFIQARYNLCIINSPQKARITKEKVIRNKKKTVPPQAPQRWSTSKLFVVAHHGIPLLSITVQ